MSNDYTHTRGDAWAFTVGTITDLAGAAVSDVSLWGCKWTMRNAISGAVVASASTDAATISRGSGLFSWVVPKATTAAIVPDVYPYDVEITDQSGNPQTAHGYITVLKDQSI